jgi:hypothetical protein
MKKEKMAKGILILKGEHELNNEMSRRKMTKEEMAKRVLELKGEYEPDEDKVKIAAAAWYKSLLAKHGEKKSFDIFWEKFRRLYSLAHQREVEIYCQTLTGDELEMMIQYYGSSAYAREKTMAMRLAGNNLGYLATLEEAFTGEKCAGHT